ncbi:MAG: hypothetical protein WBD28_03620 [Candidatus Zixiibacteriota bacterium]
MNSKTSLIVISCSLLLFFVWGCGELEKGEYPTNVPPQLYLVNVPTGEASFSINPRVYWWGTDSDGRITEFQYLVIPESKMDLDGKSVDLGLIPDRDGDGFVDSLFVKAIEGIPHTEWVDTLIAKHLEKAGYHAHRDSLTAVIDTQTSVNLIMFAELDTTIFVNQYFFVRAVDNNGSTSKIWKSKAQGGHVFRRLSRNNHPPNTHIDTISFAKRGVYYSLPETTDTWKGIKLQWEGSDSSDYTAKQPDFYYKWELFGPFKDTFSVDLNLVVDSSWNKEANSRWVMQTSRTFFNLKNYNEANGGHHGWYLFRIICRDDAFVVDETPDHVFIHIVHPLIDFWPDNQRNVLLVDVSRYGSPKHYGFPMRDDREKVLDVYKEWLSNIEGETDINFDVWYDPVNPSDAIHPPPNELLLSKYKLVIVINHGRFSGVKGHSLIDSGYVQYQNYLNVGGNIWFVGINNWSLNKGGWHLIDFGAPLSDFRSRYVVVDMARFYFGLLQAYFPSWDVGNRNDEFIGAKPFLGTTDFPYLESDSATVKTLLNWKEGEYDPMGNAIPGACSMVLSAWTDRLYDFESSKGMDSNLNGKPCAVRFTGKTFKTAEFAFPLYLTKNDQAQEAMKIMINWFLETGLP